MIRDGASLNAMLEGAATDPRQYLVSLGYKPPHLRALAKDAEPLPAQVNHGTWIAIDGCGERNGVQGGGVVWLSAPVVWCPLCCNRATGRKWRPVALPADRAAIEAALAVRPEENRNWVPGETVDDLLRENREHGIGEGT